MNNAQQVLDGVMLSDGNLRLRKGCRNAYFIIDLSEGHLDWLLMIRDALTALGVLVSDRCPAVSTNHKGYTSQWLWTHAHPFLTSQYEIWYPNGYKEVPCAFGLTPVSLANEYMGDGGLNTGHKDCILCTEGYSLNEVNFLRSALLKMGIQSISRPYKRTRRGAGFRIYIRRNSIRTFMSAIEPYVVPSYRYKLIL